MVKPRYLVVNRAATPGYRALMYEIRGSDLHDPWGTTLGWMGGIADVLYLRSGETMPDYRPSPLLNDKDQLDDGSEGQTVLELLNGGHVTEDDLRSVYTVLNRFADWVERAGRNY